MKHATYFSRAVPGVAAREYCLLNTAGTAVIRTQMSRPDGTEVSQPRGVRWEIKAPASSLKHESKGTAGHLHMAKQSVSGIAVRACPECERTRPVALFTSTLGRATRRCAFCRGEQA